MSRSQSTQTFKTARNESKQNFENSQNSYKKAQTDIGAYEDQLAKYAASNPFVQGGEFQSAENRVLAGTAGGIADSARAELESSGARRGDNPALADAGAAAIADRAQRNLASEQATAEAQRIGRNADYGRSVLQAKEFPVQAETGLYRDTSNASNQQLDAQQRAAAANKSFMDSFGGSFAESLGNTLGSLGRKK